LTGTSEEDLRKQFREGSEERVKTNLVLEAIVEKENIEVSEDEINDEIKDLRTQYGIQEKTVRSALSDDILNHDLTIRKVFHEIIHSTKQDLPEKKEEK